MRSLREELEEDVETLSPEAFNKKYKLRKAASNPADVITNVWTRGLFAGCLLGRWATVDVDFIDDDGVAYRRLDDDMYVYEVPAVRGRTQYDAPDGEIRVANKTREVVSNQMYTSRRTGVCQIN